MQCISEEKVRKHRGRPTRETAQADDAKWDAIFREKFVDPEYYGHRSPTLQSSFSGFARQMEGLCRG